MDAILDNLDQYVQPDREMTTFEASCYTDPLGLEHLTGSLSAAIEWFGRREGVQLRWVTKYDRVEPLLGLAHHGRTRCRISLNAAGVARQLEGGTADLPARVEALRKLVDAGYPVGVVLAPIMPIPDWRTAYAEVLDRVAAVTTATTDLTFELITHRFTPGSKQVLLDWYPNTGLDLDEAGRRKKYNKFGGHKFVYRREQLGELREWMYREIGERFGREAILYFT